MGGKVNKEGGKKIVLEAKVPEGYEYNPDYPGEGYSSPFRVKKGGTTKQ